MHHDVSALFIIIPMPVLLKAIDRQFIEHIEEKGLQHILKENMFLS